MAASLWNWKPSIVVPGSSVALTVTWKVTEPEL
jgi:hypothetical protein